MTRTSLSAALLLATAGLAGCDDDPSPQPPPPIPSDIFATPGQPVPFATAEQRATFTRGEAVAKHRFSPGEGLGPRFNLTFCGGCHEKPVFGGAASHYRDFYLVGQALEDGTFIPSGDEGGVLQSYYAGGGRRPEPGGRDNVFANRNPIPFFGVGLIAEINEDAILANVDVDDADGDGISGRANYDRGFVGRFGMKSQTVSIEGFIRGPLNNHLGITTNPLSPEQQAALPVPSVAEDRDDPPVREAVAGLASATFHQAAAPAEPLEDSDAIPDPEMPSQDLYDLVSWAMLLAAPQPAEPTAESEAGAALFEAFNCTGCHVPSLVSPRGSIPLYSDLLLHDMGPELADGIEMGIAAGSEFRTSPLWGVAVGAPFLHDGRAATLDDAIRMHGGEGSGARDAYLAASESERAQVITFLESLGGAEVATDGLILPDAPVPEAHELGGPLAALSAADAERWRTGRALFDRDHSYKDGLGPRFNGDSCRACHFEPMIGGAGPLGLNVFRTGTMDGDAFVAPERGTILHRFVAHGARPEADESFNVFETRQTPTTMGLGLLDALTEEAILANADPNDMDGDGIRGVAHVLADGRVGRFGWKAQIPSTLDFVGDAMAAELGFTLPAELGIPFAISSDDDDVPDPEFSLEEVDALTFFINQQSPAPQAEHPAGAAVFSQIGCDACHMARLDGMPADAPAAYTDLLLHDVAAVGGVFDGMANSTQFRTPPLWGIADTRPYMHDGSAPDLTAAIEAHAGEAEASVTAWSALSAAEQADLLTFLEGL